MATPEQVAELIQLMQTQNQQMATLMQQQQPNLNHQHHGGRTKKPDRPIINAGMDDREWAVYLDSWSLYKNMTEMTDANKLRMELRASCSPDLNRMLFEFVGADVLNTCTETQMLQHIKSVAVRETHPEVHQTTFNLMKQDQGEAISRFVARLKAKAYLCKFEVTCPDHDPAKTISYADQMVAQRLVAGLANVDHQRKILSEAATLTTLDAKIQRLQVLETTDKAAEALHGNPPGIPSMTSETSASGASAARSQYKREKMPQKHPRDDTPKNSNVCKGCGSPPHPGGRTNCPAWGKICNSCRTKGHLAAVCRKSRSTPIHDDDLATHNAERTEFDSTSYGQIPSESAVSFSFSAAQDFRSSRRNNDET